MISILRKDGFGIGVLFGMFALVLVMVIIGNHFFMITNNLMMAGREADFIRAYYVADAGLADAYIQLRNSTEPSGPGDFSFTNAGYPAVPGKTGKYDVVVTNDGESLRTYTIVSTGYFGSAVRKLQIRVKQQTFTKWSYFTGTEQNVLTGDNKWHKTGSEIWGPIHTNTQFHISGSPIFHGPVTQYMDKLVLNPSNSTPDFQQGITYSVPKVDLSEAIGGSNGLLKNIENTATAAGQLYTGNTTIELFDNGDVVIVNGGNTLTINTSDYNALYVTGGNITLAKSKLKGSFTVGCGGSGGNIYIKGDLTYSKDPMTDPTSTDILALVAQNKIRIDKDFSGADWPDLSIYAYVIAGFENQDTFFYQDWDGSLANLRGNLKIYGGMTGRGIGPMGHFNINTQEPEGGFASHDYRYDERFGAGLIPPCFLPLRDEGQRIIYSKVEFREI